MPDQGNQSTTGNRNVGETKEKCPYKGDLIVLANEKSDRDIKPFGKGLLVEVVDEGSGETDSNGIWECNQIPRGSQLVEASIPADHQEMYQLVEFPKKKVNIPGGGSCTVQFNVRLVTKLIISARELLKGSSSKDLEGVDVVVKASSYNKTDHTGKDGMVTFPGVPVGQAEISVKLSPVTDRKLEISKIAKVPVSRADSAGTSRIKRDARAASLIFNLKPVRENKVVIDAAMTKSLLDPVMTISFAVADSAEMDSDYPKYHLKSDDGSYDKILSPKDDLVPGDGFLQLRFEGLLEGSRYTLTIEVDEGHVIEAFSGREFAGIADTSRDQQEKISEFQFTGLEMNLTENAAVEQWSE